MQIPSYQECMLPVLKEANKGETSVRDAVDTIALYFKLSEEAKKYKLPSGIFLLYSRVHWAITYLAQASLVQRTKRGCFIITAEGKKLLSTNPNCIDNQILSNYPGFQDFIKRSKKKITPDTKQNIENIDDLSPEEAIYKFIDTINSSLANELLNRILKETPAFFENLIGSLLKAMGYGSDSNYGGWVHTGKSSDNGIDGLINQDILGVDKIYVQAKRYSSNNAVTSVEMRNFVGALDMHRSVKGIFVTTSYFTKDAEKTVKQSTKNIVLIDGIRLTDLMIRYNVGCEIKETITVKRIDNDFFNEI